MESVVESLKTFRSGLISNRAGGFAHPITARELLDRVLILGTFDNTYYASGGAMTVEALTRLADLIRSDGIYVVDRAVDVSRSGRAPSNDPALLVMAMALSVGDVAIRAYAAERLPLVARTGTHLMTFLEFAVALRGWGRLLKKATSNWFTSFSPRDLAYQAIKYQNRGAWSLRRALCDAHVRDESERNDVLRWIACGWPSVGDEPHPDPALRQIWAYERLRRLSPSETGEAVRLIVDYRLPREAVPTHFLSSKEVWEALLVSMPMTALLRNLATLTRIGVLEPLSDTTREAVRRLTDPRLVRVSRLHPLKIAVARATYSSGRSAVTANAWTPIPAITQALDEAFDLAFPNVEPTNRRILIALDVSGSMSGASISALGNMTPRDAGGIMMYAIAKTEPTNHVLAFDTNVYANGERSLSITPSMSLREVLSHLDKFFGGGTDISAPIQWALNRKILTDAIIILTDNETWANKRPVSEWMNEYRATLNPDALLIVAGMTATHYSVVAPDDRQGLNIAGFDTHAPALINEFIRGFASITDKRETDGNEEEEEEA